MNHPKTIPADQPDEPPIAVAARLTIDLDAAADHPALDPSVIDAIAADMIRVGNETGDPGVERGVRRLIAYIRYLERLRCDGCGTSLGYHNHAARTLCGPCANGAEPEQVNGSGYTEEHQPEEPEEDAPAQEPIIVHVPGPYPADAIDALAEAAGWASRWSFEHRRADDLNEQLGWVESVHYPYETPDDPHVKRRCRGCIAGYDPRTGQLLNAAWPCATERAKNGERHP